MKLKRKKNYRKALADLVRACEDVAPSLCTRYYSYRAFRRSLEAAKRLLATIAFLALTLTYGASLDTDRCVTAVVGEAASQSYREKLAIACAIRNRGTLQGVYGLTAKHVATEPAWVWRDARRAWAESAQNDITHGATHWEGTAFHKPAWAARMQQTAEIGKTRFYKP